MFNVWQAIAEWAEARNLIQGSTFSKQFIKLVEEVGEVAECIAKGKPQDELAKEIGDYLVVLTILTQQSGHDMADIVVEATPEVFLDVDSAFAYLASDTGQLGISVQEQKYFTLQQCFETIAGFAHVSNLAIEDAALAAYNKIKDRKGRMENGIFIKEGD